MLRWLLIVLGLLVATPALALQPPSGHGGEVRVPLEDYERMLALLNTKPRPAPATYAIGRSSVAVEVAETDRHTTASVAVTFRVETFEDEWTLIPLLPPGAALREASVDGRPVQLVEGPDGLSWSTNEAKAVTVVLRYSADAERSPAGYVLSLPVPRAAATDLALAFPRRDVDLAVVPSADLRHEAQGDKTLFTASIPATSSILVSWRAAGKRPYAVSRAHYSGSLRDDALIWTARFQVELFGDAAVSLPVMPGEVTLNDIRVDGEAATVVVDKGMFVTMLQGRGSHEVMVDFQVPVVSDQGAPRAHLRIPRIPVSRFDLVLPGRKEVKVNPIANVETVIDGEETKARAFIPMSENVLFTWTEAVPEDLRGQVRANASLYHVVRAEEGVLHALATVVYEITHGATNVLELEIPENTQVNRINSPTGALSDWAVTESEREDHKRIAVFLDHDVGGEFVLEVSYELLLGTARPGGEPVLLPLLGARDVHRQRGMVALVAGKELALQPVLEEGVSKVGENQLPAFVRDRISATIAHTYKYTERTARLSVEPVVPERRQGKYDAQVDSLISLGEVTLKGSATVEVEVKSGTLLDLELRLPSGVNVLDVTGPSIRSHEVRESGDAQAIEIEFTREMDGRFRLEIAYERIMDSKTAEVAVPTVGVPQAEVEHGRIAIEALSAVEVRALETEQLSSLDIRDLPQQLVLKTTNPILLAYRYVSAKRPFKLVLAITRHQEIDVQVAAIERAHFSSLFTRDGLVVTTARLMVRNSRQQFLRLALPSGSEVWSVFVDGKPEKPAFAKEGEDGARSAILVKMINSSTGFPVEVVYASPIEPIDWLGQLSSRLPRPDMVVTHTRWDVFLPLGPHYLTPDSSMDMVIGGVRTNPRQIEAEMMARASDAYQAQIGQPLRIAVPRQGIHYAFEKLYANQSPEEAGFEVRYLSAGVDDLGLVVSGLAVILLWVGIAALAGRGIKLPTGVVVLCLLSGLALLAFTVGYLETSPLLASGLALALAVVLAAAWAVQFRRTRRATASDPEV
jgi:hypothetical protein